jgi:DNA-binding LytR/AlgR family response regulator
VNNKLNQFVRLLGQKMRLFLSISFGIFLFVLFFQPFPLDRFDFNNRLLFIAGLAAIVFLFMVLARVFFPWLVKDHLRAESEFILPSYMSGFFILTLSSVAFSFYLRYVGRVDISFYVVFKIVLICLAPPIALWLYQEFDELRSQNELLIGERKLIQKKVEEYEEDNLNKTIVFNSENSTESISFLIAEVAFINSADNYVEIVYKEGGNFKKKLIRNTLRNIELQIKPYSNFIRCHRICIVNMHFVEKLDKSYSNTSITIKGYPDPIPVSRQYLLKLKEAL